MVVQVYADIEKEHQSLKYMRDITDEATHYFSALVVNIFNGVSRNIGVDNPDKLAATPPTVLMKGFLDGIKDIISRITGILLKKKPNKPFKINGMTVYRQGKPMTQGDWDRFNKQVAEYLKPYTNSMAEAMAVKSVLLAMATAEMERKRQNPEAYGKKSFEQIEKEYYGGAMPETIKQAKEQGYTTKTSERAILESYDQIAAHVQKVSDNVRWAIRNKVAEAIRENKTPKQLASDLYWMRKEDEQFKKVDKDTAQMLVRDWHRVAVTEMMYAHAAGKMAATDDQASKSLERPELAVYFAFVGGTCEWCVPHHGAIVRQIPAEMADVGNDSLSALGIKDPYTDIAVWIGKNNVGFKKPSWRVCTPAHPWNTAHLARIYPDAQWYNPKSGRIEYKSTMGENDYLPTEIAERQKRIEADRERVQAEMEADRQKNEHKSYRDYIPTETSTAIGTDTNGRRIVSYKDRMYVEVPNEDFIARNNEWRENRHLPIPVAIGSKDHEEIFG